MSDEHWQSFHLLHWSRKILETGRVLVGFLVLYLTPDKLAELGVEENRVRASCVPNLVLKMGDTFGQEAQSESEVT